MISRSDRRPSSLLTPPAPQRARVLTHVPLVAVLAALTLGSCGLSLQPAPLGETRISNPSLRAPKPRERGAESQARQPPIFLRRGFLDRPDGAQIWFESAGEGDTVVLIHGLGGNHAVWYRQFSRLAEDYHVVTLSQRGFAPSRTPTSGFDPELLAADVVGLLDHLQVERAHIVGQSMGGWTALRFALNYPARTISVTLADTTAGIFDDRIREHYRAVQTRAGELSQKPPVLGMHPALDPAFSRTHRAESGLYQALSSFGAPAPAAIAQALGGAEVDHQRLLENQTPTLFVVGQRDPIFPIAIVLEAANYLPGSEVKVIPDTGHSPYFEAPNRWRQVVTKFWDQSSSE